MISPDLTGGHGVKPIPTIIPTPTDFQTAGDHGFRTLWVVFVVMVISSVIFAAVSWKVPVSRRVYHVTTTLITIVAALSYFAMASGQATAYHCTTVTDHHGHDIPNTHHEVCRQVFWGRYVGWTLTGSLLLVNLCLLAGIDGAHTLMAVVANLIAVLSGLFAAFGREHTVQKWGWYAISCVAYLFVVWHVALHGSKIVKAKGSKQRKLFGSLAAFTLITWTVYPIVWGVIDGSRKATVDSEIIAYAVLDILTKTVFGIWLLSSVRKFPETNIEVGGYWSQSLATEGGIRIGDEENGA